MSYKDNKQFSIVYQITNLLNGKIYIGAHCTDNVNDNYMGSSKSLKKDIKELGKQNFEKIPIHIFDNQEDMRKKEAELVTKEFCLREDTYNLMKGGIQIFTWIGTVVVKDKDGNTSRVYKEDPRYLSGELIGVRTNNKGQKHDENTKLRISIANKGKNTGKKHSDERNEQNRIKHIGKKHSNETKEKMRLAALGNTRALGKTGYKHTKEAKQKIGEKSSINNLGRKQSEQEKLNQIKAQTGRKQSEETKLKIKESQLKRLALKKL